MKLSSELVERTQGQLEAEVIPEDHPAVAQLNRLFGDHTFFLDEAGLLIVEPTESSDSGAQSGMVVKIASWTDASRLSLAPHEPEATNVVVMLDEAA